MRLGLSSALLSSTFLFCTLTAAAQTAPAPDNQAAPPPQEMQQAPPPPEMQQQAPPPAQASGQAYREWVPEGLRWMGRNATSRTEFTLDHSMLALATKADSDNAELRRVIAGINGVSVHSFRFAQGVSFDPEAWAALVREYREAGWQHVASKRPTDGNGISSDWWVRMEGGAVRDFAVMFTGVRQLNFVSVSGSIAPLDLLHLSGHFGIPKMNSGVVLPEERVR